MKKVLVTIAVLCTAMFSAHAQVTTLNEAVVTSTRASKKTPVAQTTIGNTEIKQSNIGADIPYIMELAPSVVISSESGLGLGNTSFRIRGSDASRTNVTIDGVPVNDAESQSVYWVNMPDFTSSVNSIQIQRGIGSSTNGAAAFGATVNMQTALPSSIPYAEISTSVGMYNTFRNNIKIGTGIIGRGFTFDARYSNVQSDGYIYRSGANHQSLYASGAWHGKNTLVKTSILYGEQHTGLSWNGVPGYAIDSIKYPYYKAGVPDYKHGIDWRYNPVGEYLDNQGKIQYYSNSDNYKQTHYRLHLSQNLAAKWTLNTTLFLTRGLGYYEDYKLNRKLKDYGMDKITINNTVIEKSDLIRQKWMDNYFYGLTFTTSYSTEKLQWIIGGGANRYNGDHYGKVLWVRYANNIEPNKEWYRNNGTKDDYSIYTKATWQINNRLSIYGDIQYRHVKYEMEGNDDDLAALNQQHKFNFINPKGGVYFEIDDKNKAYASLSIGNREPSRADYKDASKFGSKEEPKAERMYDIEAGYNFTNSDINLGVNVYYMHYKNQLTPTGKLSSVGYAIKENVPNSYRTGIELMAGIQLFNQLRFESNVTISRNKIKNFVAYTVQYDNNSNWAEVAQKIEILGETDLSFSPEITGSGLLKYMPIEQLSLSLLGRYAGKQFYDNTSSADRQLNAYFVSSLKADYLFRVFGINSSMQILLNNIFNKQYITSAWVYRAVFADGSLDYLENGFFPQAGRNIIAKLTISF